VRCLVVGLHSLWYTERLEDFTLQGCGDMLLGKPPSVT